MAFTFTQARELKPEQVNPFSNLVSKALQGYGQGMRAAYLPRELEADIFAKQIGPLATLATTPTFMNDLQFQENLRNLISRQIPSLGFGNTEDQDIRNAPTYAGQAQIDADEAMGLAKYLTKSGDINRKLSSGSAWIQSQLGDIGTALFNKFTGGGITPDLAQKENKLKTILANMENQAVQTKRLSPEKAKEIFTKHPDETWEGMINRIKRTNPYLWANNNLQTNQVIGENDIPRSIDEKIARDEKERPKAQNNFREAPEGSIGLYKNGELYYIPAEKVNKALKEGFTYE